MSLISATASNQNLLGAIAFFNGPLPLLEEREQETENALSREGYSCRPRRIVMEYLGYTCKVNAEKVNQLIKDKGLDSQEFSFLDPNDSTPLTSQKELFRYKLLAYWTFKVPDNLQGAAVVPYTVDRQLQVNMFILINRAKLIFPRGMDRREFNLASHFLNVETHDLLDYRQENNKIIEFRDARKDRKNKVDCIAFVFGRESWYSQVKKWPNQWPEFLSFIQTKGYSVVKVPSVGAISVHVNILQQVKHVGNVHKIEENGRIIIQSKSGDSHIYENPLDGTEVEHGNYVFYIRWESAALASLMNSKAESVEKSSKDADKKKSE